MTLKPDSRAVLPSPQSLKPCAHCGSPAYMLKGDVDFNVKCTNGDCQMASPRTIMSRMAAEIWNARAPQAVDAPEEIHSCSYFCERPACIKAQRDELRDRAVDAPVALREITDEERQFLSYNPNTDDLVVWIQDYASEAVRSALSQERPNEGGADV
jgi:hypothetical protein